MSLQIEQFKKTLLAACRQLYADRLITLAVFGSWARGTASPGSDIDLLLVADNLPNGRMKRMAQFQPVDEATFLIRKKIWPDMPDVPAPELAPMFKTTAEVALGSPLFLDMTDWIDFLFDQNSFFANYLEELRSRLKKLGARRRWLAGGYYWEYKPDLKPSEIIVL
jgi:predicted nucleotidyltransferase